MGIIDRLFGKGKVRTADAQLIIEAAGWPKAEQYLMKLNRQTMQGGDPDHLEMPEEDYNEACEYVRKKRERERIMNETARLNSEGMALEKEGRVEEAIQTYERCIATGYPARNAFTRLAIIYHKRKEYDNERRVLEDMQKVFGGDAWAGHRLSSLNETEP